MDIQSLITWLHAEIERANTDLHDAQVQVLNTRSIELQTRIAVLQEILALVSKRETATKTTNGSESHWNAS